MYHTIVIAIYLVAIAGLLKWAPTVFRYQPSGRGFVFALVGFVITTILFYLLNSLISFDKFSIAKITTIRLIDIVIYAVFFAFAEELIFRGILQKFLQGHTSTVLAIIISALIFGLAHLGNSARGLALSQWNWKFFEVATLGGLSLGTVYALTGELFAPTLLHALFIIGLQIFTK